MKHLVKAMIAAGLLAAQAGALHAAVSADEAKKLGTTLTLVGAEKAGNKDGTIPEYTGGLTTPPAGFVKGSGVRPDPFASEKPLFSIDAKNMAQYADKLTDGTKALMKGNADYRIDVYKTHRTAAYPKSVLDNTVKNATKASLDANLDPHGARAGIPFPIPKTGAEVMTNFLTAYKGQGFTIPKYRAYNVDSSGKAVLSTQGVWTQESVYYDESKAGDPTLLARAKVSYTGPARRAGEAILSQEMLVYGDKGSRRWQYLPGQRRVRLAPDLAYDAPNPSTSGMSTIDDINLFAGKMDRFDWKLVGKKEMYVPYNTYKLTYTDKAEDVFGPKFVNPAMVRWELHRVWVVEATLKEGKRHIYSKRTFYVDEDSWIALASDQYDGRGQLWRPGFAYLTQSYDMLASTATMVGHFDLIAGTYYINLWPGSGGVKIADERQPDSAWSPEGLAGAGVR
ncbi:DUF1329 domain-containing protein [Noviherbaspirillum saxi]|uniref:DUF1329 domain-containing protein n=1 Tax=Noviherbaspirillum saxi TaxID=2320863 RepID=A0A3A3FEW2_9BURK|nr:DUF1329 domain-containing protein [Noviherbaspirillum saxi]RJF91881.1 DUF1329 domain-containing protein [Noviherbaspirillum saxi]